MSRDDIKKMLGEGVTEEQVTNVLNLIHTSNKEKDEQIKGLETINSQFADYDELKKYKEEVEKSKMTEQEKLEQLRKETQENYAKSQVILNTTKAKEILAGLDLDDDIISSLVSNDETKTINNATKLRDKMNTLKENTIKQTKEELNTLNLQPNIENKVLDDGVMTSDKFFDLSSEEQEKFINEHPDEFNNL